MNVEVSVGEFLDKMTILEIKSERIEDEEKLRNIGKELELLKKTWAASPLSSQDVSKQVMALKSVNETLWQIEDDIRLKESRREFDETFIELARSVYINNDLRARIKKDINLALGSNLVEEKSYKDYTQP